MSSKKVNGLYTKDFKLKVLEYYFRHGGDSKFGLKSKTAHHFAIDIKTINRMLCKREIVKGALRLISKKHVKPHGTKSEGKEDEESIISSNIKQEMADDEDESHCLEDVHLDSREQSSEEAPVIELPEDPDFSVLKKTIDSSVSGVADIAKLLITGTDEVKRILTNECDLILECKVCRNLFRSAVNLLAHKRIYCLEEQTNVRSLYKKNTGYGVTSESPMVIIESDPPTDQGPSNSGGGAGKRELKIDKIASQLANKKSKGSKEVFSSSTNTGSSSYFNKLQEENEYKKTLNTSCAVLLQDIAGVSSAVYQTYIPPQSDKQPKESMQEAVKKHIHERKKETPVHLDAEGRVIEKESKVSEPTPSTNPTRLTPVKSEASTHDQQDQEIVSYPCNSCALKFTSKKLRAGHIEDVHGVERSIYTCPICNVIFLSIWGCVKHLIRVHKKKKHQRERLKHVICSRSHKKVFTTKDLLKLSHKSSVQIMKKREKESQADTSSRGAQKERPQSDISLRKETQDHPNAKGMGSCNLKRSPVVVEELGLEVPLKLSPKKISIQRDSSSMSKQDKCDIDDSFPKLNSVSEQNSNLATDSAQNNVDSAHGSALNKSKSTNDSAQSSLQPANQCLCVDNTYFPQILSKSSLCSTPALPPQSDNLDTESLIRSLQSNNPNTKPETPFPQPGPISLSSAQSNLKSTAKSDLHSKGNVAYEIKDISPVSSSSKNDLKSIPSAQSNVKLISYSGLSSERNLTTIFRKPKSVAECTISKSESLDSSAHSTLYSFTTNTEKNSTSGSNLAKHPLILTKNVEAKNNMKKSSGSVPSNTISPKIIQSKFSPLLTSGNLSSKSDDIAMETNSKSNLESSQSSSMLSYNSNLSNAKIDSVSGKNQSSSSSFSTPTQNNSVAAPYVFVVPKLVSGSVKKKIVKDSTISSEKLDSNNTQNDLKLPNFEKVNKKNLPQFTQKEPVLSEQVNVEALPVSMTNKFALTSDSDQCILKSTSLSQRDLKSIVSPQNDLKSSNTSESIHIKSGLNFNMNNYLNAKNKFISTNIKTVTALSRLEEKKHSSIDTSPLSELNSNINHLVDPSVKESVIPSITLREIYKPKDYTIIHEISNSIEDPISNESNLDSVSTGSNMIHDSVSKICKQRHAPECKTTLREENNELSDESLSSITDTSKPTENEDLLCCISEVFGYEISLYQNNVKDTSASMELFGQDHIFISDPKDNIPKNMDLSTKTSGKICKSTDIDSVPAMSLYNLNEDEIFLDRKECFSPVEIELREEKEERSSQKCNPEKFSKNNTVQSKGELSKSEIALSSYVSPLCELISPKKYQRIEQIKNTWKYSKNKCYHNSKKSNKMNSSIECNSSNSLQTNFHSNLTCDKAESSVEDLNKKDARLILKEGIDSLKYESDCLQSSSSEQTILNYSKSINPSNTITDILNISEKVKLESFNVKEEDDLDAIEIKKEEISPIKDVLKIGLFDEQPTSSIAQEIKKEEPEDLSTKPTVQLEVERDEFEDYTGGFKEESKAIECSISEDITSSKMDLSPSRRMDYSNIFEKSVSLDACLTEPMKIDYTGDKVVGVKSSTSTQDILNCSIGSNITMKTNNSCLKDRFCAAGSLSSKEIILTPNTNSQFSTSLTSRIEAKTLEHSRDIRDCGDKLIAHNTAANNVKIFLNKKVDSSASQPPSLIYPKTKKSLGMMKYHKSRLRVDKLNNSHTYSKKVYLSKKRKSSDKPEICSASKSSLVTKMLYSTNDTQYPSTSYANECVLSSRDYTLISNCLWSKDTKTEYDNIEPDFGKLK